MVVTMVRTTGRRKRRRQSPTLVAEQQADGGGTKRGEEGTISPRFTLPPVRPEQTCSEEGEKAEGEKKKDFFLLSTGSRR